MSGRARIDRHGINHICGGSDPIPGICNVLDPTLVDPQWAKVETLMLNSRDSDGAAMSTVLTSGQQYLVTIKGTYSIFDAALTSGDPEPDAQYPDAISRASTEVGRDAETEFANLAGGTLPIHKDGGGGGGLKINLGAGLTHIEPVGGPFTTPEPQHLYTYQLTGAGSAPTFKVIDGDYTDNYGLLKITLYVSGGPGAVPNPALQPDGAWLRVAGGALVYVTDPPVTSIAASGDTPMHGDIEIAGGDGVDVTQDDAGTLTVSTTVSGSGSGDTWLDDTAETWTYASGSGGGVATFTVTGDKTAKYHVSTLVRLKQGGSYKYFVVTGSSHSSGTTTVTIFAGTSYTLANASITDNYHSYAANPQGWPGWFAYAPTITGFSGTPTTNLARFSVVGRVCTVNLDITGTSNATTFTITPPITYANVSNNAPIAATRIRDNGTSQTTPGRADLGGGTGVIRVFKDFATNAFTNTGTKEASFTLVYEI